MAVNETIRGFVKECLDKAKPFSTSKDRLKLFKEFCNTTDGIDYDKHRTVLLNETKKELTKRGLDPITFGLGRVKEKEFQIQSGGLQAKINPKLDQHNNKRQIHKLEIYYKLNLNKLKELIQMSLIDH